MLSNPTHIIKNAILLMVLLCLLAFSTACSAPASDESSEKVLPRSSPQIPNGPHTPKRTTPLCLRRRAMRTRLFPRCSKATVQKPSMCSAKHLTNPVCLLRFSIAAERQTRSQAASPATSIQLLPVQRRFIFNIKERLLVRSALPSSAA